MNLLKNQVFALNSTTDKNNSFTVGAWWFKSQLMVCVDFGKPCFFEYKPQLAFCVSPLNMTLLKTAVTPVVAYKECEKHIGNVFALYVPVLPRIKNIAVRMDKRVIADNAFELMPCADVKNKDGVGVHKACPHA